LLWSGCLYDSEAPFSLLIAKVTGSLGSLGLPLVDQTLLRFLTHQFPMRVALVHDWLTGMRGGEKCLEVFCELFPDADLYTLVYLPDRVSPIIRSMKIHASWFNQLPGVESYYRYGLPLFPRVIEGFALKNYDLILSSSHCVAKGILPHRALHIAYIHAPMRYVWDQHEAYFGAGSTSIERLGMALCRGYLQSWDVRSAQRVDHFVANSNNVAAKIRRFYKREATTIYPPVDIDRFSVVNGPGNFYLVVSALVPYKRVEHAVTACNELRVPLKIVGEGPLRQKLERRAGPHVEFLGWVDDALLPRLYASCRALLFPGEEDFGIVAIEAQASGRPVIAFGRGGLLETVNGLHAASWNRINGSADCSTGVFFQEPTVASLMNAIQHFERNAQAFDPTAIRAHAAKFSRAHFKDRVAEFVAEKIRQRNC
jgi:glycosyltransferase involved in cell wall biosynthesis